MSYTELTVWTRGIIMDKEGRDIVNSVAAAGRLEGRFAQAMENYVDNPDRTNAPTRKYCRLSDGEIENALTYENEQPNIVVLVEQTMVKGWDYMRGMPPGGTLVINTHYTPEYMIRFVPGAERLAQLVCVDAAKLADHKWLYYRLGELGLDRLSTEGAAERALDDEGVQALHGLLSAQARRGGSVLFTSHQAVALRDPVPQLLDLDEFAIAA